MSLVILFLSVVLNLILVLVKHAPAIINAATAKHYDPMWDTPDLVYCKFQIGHPSNITVLNVPMQPQPKALSNMRLGSLPSSA